MQTGWEAFGGLLEVEDIGAAGYLLSASILPTFRLLFLYFSSTSLLSLIYL